MDEIERRFLAHVGPGFPPPGARPRRVRQGYLVGGELEIRIREMDGSFILGAKAGSGRRRSEKEVEVSADVGGALLAQAGDWSLEKLRWEIGPWEVDVYGGKLRGLVVAECELGQEGEALPEPPAAVGLGREITEEPELNAQRLSRLSREECRSLLARLGLD